MDNKNAKPERIELANGFYWSVRNGCDDLGDIRYPDGATFAATIFRQQIHALFGNPQPVPSEIDEALEHNTTHKLIEAVERIVGPGMEVAKKSLYATFRTILARHRQPTPVAAPYGADGLREALESVLNNSVYITTAMQDCYASDSYEDTKVRTALRLCREALAQSPTIQAGGAD